MRVLKRCGKAMYKYAKRLAGYDTHKVDPDTVEAWVAVNERTLPAVHAITAPQAPTPHGPPPEVLMGMLKECDEEYVRRYGTRVINTEPVMDTLNGTVISPEGIPMPVSDVTTKVYHEHSHQPHHYVWHKSINTYVMHHSRSMPAMYLYISDDDDDFYSDITTSSDEWMSSSGDCYSDDYIA